MYSSQPKIPAAIIRLAAAIFAVVICWAYMSGGTIKAHEDGESYELGSAPLSLGTAAGQSSAAGMTVMEVTSGRVLYSKDKDVKRPMASTTKVVTAIVVIENVDDLDKVIEVPAAAVGIEGSSIYLAAGEHISIRDLLYGLMLRSGNDAATALAITVGGSVDKFAVMMNDFARRVGAVNSNFTNPHGLHHDNHYTTAFDLALMSAYAMNNTVFREIAATKKHNATWEGRDYPRVMFNKNKILNNYEGGNGVKTGFTKKAGRCLVSSAERGGMTVVCVVLNCGPMFEECMALMSTAFDNYTMTDLLTCGTTMAKTAVAGGKSDSVGVCVKSNYRYPLTAQEALEVKTDIKIPDSIKAPVSVGQEIGCVEITLNNQLIFKAKAYTIEGVKRLTLIDKFVKFFNK